MGAELGAELDRAKDAIRRNKDWAKDGAERNQTQLGLGKGRSGALTSLLGYQRTQSDAIRTERSTHLLVRLRVQDDGRVPFRLEPRHIVGDRIDLRHDHALVVRESDEGRNWRADQTQSDAIRRNQTQSDAIRGHL
jgi:hypothetical protein